MSEKAVVGLPTWFEAESEDNPVPTRGRVSVSERDLTLADQDGEISFPLSAVADVRPGYVPDVLGPVPPDRVPVTVAFASEDDLSVALVANREPVARKFALTLIATVLDGGAVGVRHPDRIGDARPDTSFRRGTLRLSPETIGFDVAPSGRIEAHNVTAFGRTRDTVRGTEQQLVAVDFVRDDVPCRSLVRPGDSQVTSLLGRYLELHI